MKTLEALFGVFCWPFEPKWYVTKHSHSYFSKRYQKWLLVPEGFKCDGSTWSPNIGWGWLFHDWAFFWGRWADGTPITWRQANMVMKDIQEDEGWPRWVRKTYWKGIRSKWSLSAWKGHRSKDGFRK